VNSFPERLDIHGAVQFEQTPLQRRIDDQLMLADKPSVSPHVPPSQRTHQRLRAPPKRSTNHSMKLQPKLLRDHQGSHQSFTKYKTKKERKPKYET
jgi:hypothetical protein